MMNTTGLPVVSSDEFTIEGFETRPFTAREQVCTLLLYPSFSPFESRRRVVSLVNPGVVRILLQVYLSRKVAQSKDFIVAHGLND